jgi:hypothetical protein
MYMKDEKKFSRYPYGFVLCAARLLYLISKFNDKVSYRIGGWLNWLKGGEEFDQEG